MRSFDKLIGFANTVKNEFKLKLCQSKRKHNDLQQTTTTTANKSESPQLILINSRPLAWSISLISDYGRGLVLSKMPIYLYK